VTLPDQAAATFSALAVYCGVSYVWRRRFRTRVTSRGIEVRGYFNHFVTSDEVRGIEVSALGSARAFWPTLRPRQPTVPVECTAG
jgi:hypothetical protein